VRALLALLAILVCAPARAEELDTKEDVELQRLKIYFLPSYFYFTATTLSTSKVNPTASQSSIVSGFSFGAGANYALSNDWAIGGALREAYGSGGGFNTVFMALDVGLNYAITGSMMETRRTLRASGAPLVDTSTDSSHGFRLGFDLAQYFVNAPTTTLPFSGFGGSVGYEFAVRAPVSTEVGFRADRLSNGKTVIFSYQWYLKLIDNI
jgi:hypothetical protein